MTRVQAGPRRPARVSRKALLVFLLGCATTPAIVWIINRAPQAAAPAMAILRPDTTGPADAIVVLGAAVIEGCTLNMNGIRRVVAGRPPVP